MQDVQKIQEGTLEVVLSRITSIQDAYKPESDEFIAFIQDRGVISPEVIWAYVDRLNNRMAQGKRAFISAETYNKHVKTVKNRVRLMLKMVSTNLTDIERYRVNEVLSEIKYRKINSRAVTDEKIPTHEELGILLQEAPKRIGLMIEFLVATGCRISEALNVTLGDVTKRKKMVAIRVRGKGGKEREVYVDRKLYDRIIVEFNDEPRLYLFQHDGRQYNRRTFGSEIKRISEKTIGKSLSPHSLRHLVGTRLTRKHGLWAAKSYLGHSSVNTTQEYYNHNKVTATDIQDLFSD